MSDKYVLDASALLRFTDDQPGADQVQRLLTQANSGGAELLMSAVNWGEVFYALARENGLDRSRQVVGWLRQLPITLITANEWDAEDAAAFRFQFKVPYADSYAGALAMRENAALVTADYDFKAVGSAVRITFLPAQPRRRNRP